MSGILAIAFVSLVIADACVIMSAYICSRFIFNRYLKKYHRQKWEELVYDGDYWSVRLGYFDITPQMKKFRTESDDDLGDARITKLRKTSMYLFRIGIGGLVSLIIIFFVGGITAILLGA